MGPEKGSGVGLDKVLLYRPRFQQSPGRVADFQPITFYLPTFNEKKTKITTT